MDGEYEFVFGNFSKLINNPKLKKLSFLPLHKIDIMALELEGTVIKLLALQSGESARGPWKKQEYILETEGQYPKQVCFHAWGDNVDKFAIREGEKIKASIEINSREFNGRWYTDVRAWRVDRLDGVQTPPPGMPGDFPPPPPPAADDEDDGLPF